MAIQLEDRIKAADDAKTTQEKAAIQTEMSTFTLARQVKIEELQTAYASDLNYYDTTTA